MAALDAVMCSNGMLMDSPVLWWENRMDEILNFAAFSDDYILALS